MNKVQTLEKPYLSGSLKLDEASLKKIFLFNLNEIYPVLLHLADTLPELSKATCFGDLENAVNELFFEVKVQILRVDAIFRQLKEVPIEKKDCQTRNILKMMVAYNHAEPIDDLSKDLVLVCLLQRIIVIKKNYFQILKSIATSLNNTNIKQYLQYCFDDCEDNQVIFKLIAKEYTESSINDFLM